jgi:hypothetical protein
MGFQELKKVITKNYPINRTQTEQEFESQCDFLVNRYLLKKEYYNDYCAVKLKNGYCEIDFFKSDHRDLSKIESDWCDYSFSLKIKEKDYQNAKNLFKWLA